jgi:hypothetical protein
MNDSAFDEIARSTTEHVSRRASLMTLGGAGLAALLAAPFATGAKKKNNNNNKKRKKKTRRKIDAAVAAACGAQIGQCQTFLTAMRSNAQQVACCQLLTDCNFTAFGACINANMTPPL